MNYLSHEIRFANHPELVAALGKFSADHPYAKGLDEKHILEARNSALQSHLWRPGHVAKLTLFWRE